MSNNEFKLNLCAKKTFASYELKRTVEDGWLKVEGGKKGRLSFTIDHTTGEILLNAKKYASLTLPIATFMKGTSFFLVPKKDQKKSGLKESDLTFTNGRNESSGMYEDYFKVLYCPKAPRELAEIEQRYLNAYFPVGSCEATKNEEGCFKTPDELKEYVLNKVGRTSVLATMKDSLLFKWETMAKNMDNKEFLKVFQETYVKYKKYRSNDDLDKGFQEVVNRLHQIRTGNPEATMKVDWDFDPAVVTEWIKSPDKKEIAKVEPPKVEPEKTEPIDLNAIASEEDDKAFLKFWDTLGDKLVSGLKEFSKYFMYLPGSTDDSKNFVFMPLPLLIAKGIMELAALVKKHLPVEIKSDDPTAVTDATYADAIWEIVKCGKGNSGKNCYDKRKQFDAELKQLKKENSDQFPALLKDILLAEWDTLLDKTSFKDLIKKDQYGRKVDLQDVVKNYDSAVKAVAEAYQKTVHSGAIDVKSLGPAAVTELIRKLPNIGNGDVKK